MLFSSCVGSYRPLKVRQPIADQRQSFSLEAIDAHPAAPLVRQQTSGLQHLEMAGGRLPYMRKHRCDFSGRHRATIEKDRQQNAAPGRVG
jgi:hypothetical protein